MHIQLEPSDNNSIRSYGDDQVTIGETIYHQSVIISQNKIITPWPIVSVRDLNEATVQPLIDLDPEIIIIGHSQAGVLPPYDLMEEFSKKRIGLECMFIGAASRTFNVLLSEHRRVVAAIIFNRE